MKRLFLYKLYSYGKRTKFLRDSEESLVNKVRLRMIHKCFFGLHFTSTQAKWKTQINSNVKSTYEVSLKRKALISLQKILLLSRKQKAVEEQLG
jgi:hypothetical protein